MEILKKCLNPKVLLGLVIVMLGVGLLAPKLLVIVLPVLILAICPLSMVFMVAMMNKKDKTSSPDQYKKMGHEDNND